MITLKRQPSEKDGTFGQFFMDGRQLCVTVEPSPSDIPNGTYECIRHDSPAHPDTWEITNVPGHTAILIHNGNTAAKNSRGCVLVGDTYGFFDGVKGVSNSVKTLNMLRSTLPDNFTLVIQ